MRYTGGEFLAASADAMRVMAGCIAALWPAVEADLSAGRLTFTREEHYLSAVYAVTLGGNDLATHSSAASGQTTGSMVPDPRTSV